MLEGPTTDTTVGQGASEISPQITGNEIRKINPVDINVTSSNEARANLEAILNKLEGYQSNSISHFREDGVESFLSTLRKQSPNSLSGFSLDSLMSESSPLASEQKKELADKIVAELKSRGVPLKGRIGLPELAQFYRQALHSSEIQNDPKDSDVIQTIITEDMSSIPTFFPDIIKFNTKISLSSPEEQERVVDLANHLRIVIKNPELLLQMPELPQSLYEAEHLNPQDRIGMEVWLKKLGFSNLKDYYSHIEDQDVRKIINASEDILQRLSEISGTLDCRILFDRLHSMTTERMISNRLLSDAREIFDKYLIQAKPKEETSISIVESRTGHETAYYPKLKEGKHNVVIDLGRYYEGVRRKNPDNPYRELKLSYFDYQSLLNTTVHEMIHQRHAEIVGTDNFAGINIDDLITDQEYKTKSFRELYGLIDSRRSSQNVNNLGKAVEEGVAVSGELYIYNRLIEKSKQSHRDEEAEMYQLFIDHRLSSLLYSQDIYTVGTVKLIHGLQKKFGFLNTLNLIPFIDLKACRNIEAGTDSFNSIVENPELMPGLENHSLIKGLRK